VGGTILFVFLYAATDEFHQSYVPTRTPLVSDVFIDTAGGVLGLIVIWLVRFRRGK
jgi:VanZ family protein